MGNYIVGYAPRFPHWAAGLWQSKLRYESQTDLLEAAREYHSFYAGNGAKSALLYPYYYSKIIYDGLKSENEEEIITFTRAAYPGSQKLGALVWNGDIPSTFEALRQSVICGLSMSMCGITWWNSDIGGFHLGDIESAYFRELIVRWFQFGLFRPVMRLHGARKPMTNQSAIHSKISICSERIYYLHLYWNREQPNVLYIYPRGMDKC